MKRNHVLEDQLFTNAKRIRDCAYAFYQKRKKTLNHQFYYEMKL